jgi:hypothetical protein
VDLRNIDWKNIHFVDVRAPLHNGLQDRSRRDFTPYPPPGTANASSLLHSARVLFILGTFGLIAGVANSKTGFASSYQPCAPMPLPV